MSRWTGSWLGGPDSAGLGAGPAGPRGVRIGLPADGPGSVATIGRRVAAFAVDSFGSALVAGAFTAPDLPRNWSLLVFVVEYVFFTALFGQTPGMRLLGIRVVRLDTGRPLGVWRALVRIALLVALIPALITNRDGRGLHDLATGAVVVNA
ncbi:MAG: transporter [Pseudonocardiales bacterium]|nr:MAG: transporter [Pseudonocardiales bacterium]